MVLLFSLLDNFDSRINIVVQGDIVRRINVFETTRHRKCYWSASYRESLRNSCKIQSLGINSFCIDGNSCLIGCRVFYSSFTGTKERGILNLGIRNRFALWRRRRRGWLRLLLLLWSHGILFYPVGLQSSVRMWCRRMQCFSRSSNRWTSWFIFHIYIGIKSPCRNFRWYNISYNTVGSFL